MGMVFAHGPAAAPDRMMLLAIADNADDHGEAWPGVNLLAAKCCVEKRTAQRTIRRLEAAGWISIRTGGGNRGVHGPGIPNHYFINLSKVTCASPPPKVTLESTKGDTEVLAKVTPLSPEPSVEPSGKPPTLQDMVGGLK